MDDDIEKRKKELRQQARTVRAGLSPEVRRQADALIAARLYGCRVYRDATCLFIFAGVRDEIDTMPIIRQILRDRKRVALPLCLSGHRMEARLIRGVEDLQAGFYGLLQPRPECPVLSPEKIDLALVPCLTADRSGHRLGQGGGYYDRFLSQYDLPAILLCRDEEMRPLLPQAPYDIRFAGVLTQSGLYRAAE